MKLKDIDKNIVEKRIWEGKLGIILVREKYCNLYSLSNLKFYTNPRIYKEISQLPTLTYEREKE
jgi:hypothetical protein